MLRFSISSRNALLSLLFVLLLGGLGNCVFSIPEPAKETPEEDSMGDVSDETDTEVETQNVAGQWSGAVQVGNNGCEVTDWVEGQSYDIRIEITQDGKNLEARIVAGLFALLPFVFGEEPRFFGSIEGDQLSLSYVLPEPDPNATDGCPFPLVLRIDAEATGNTLEGSAAYTSGELDDSPACQELEGCRSELPFNLVPAN